jgi:heme-degrading monooxygenase HmoA
MYLEIAFLPVLEGKEAEFEAAVETARTEVYAKVEGCLSLQVRRGVERPNEYAILIEWATLEDHTERFPQTPEYQIFRGLLSGLLAGSPTVAHWRSLAS